MPTNIPVLLDRLCYRYPFHLVDSITEHVRGERVVAVKNATVNEEFFQGHFPGAPLLPGVLMVDALSQVAAILVTDNEAAPPTRVSNHSPTTSWPISSTAQHTFPQRPARSSNTTSAYVRASPRARVILFTCCAQPTAISAAARFHGI